MPDNEVPRVLRLTFEFTVPRGLRVNIRNTRRMAAVKALVAAVEALGAREFPWAQSMTVRHEWSYAWHDETEVRELPPSRENGKFAALGQKDIHLDEEDGPWTLAQLQRLDAKALRAVASDVAFGRTTVEDDPEVNALIATYSDDEG
ncbi:hypothetical protein ACIPJM_26320 [Streptomyces halstedii]|uniref:hypothetical protein n=1 Tax=Streptomyces halstedii TaxID=1944 RepID=UPI0037F6A295